MKHIHEVIVVEGRSDTATLRRFFDCDTIETGGSHVTGELLKRVAAAQKTRGVIVFTDPDSSGEHIRSILSRKIPGLKHAFIAKEKAKTARKVGVEHAAKEDLEESLAHLVTFDSGTGEPSLAWVDFLDLGLTGDAARREKICQAFHIGRCNAKTCYRRLCQLGIRAEDIRKVEAHD